MTVSDYEELEDIFNKKILDLQNKCPHKKTMWVEEYWAIGHPTGNYVLICENCKKVLKRKEPKTGEEEINA